MPEQGSSGSAQPQTELELAQRLRQLKLIEDELKRMKDELTRKEKEIVSLADNVRGQYDEIERQQQLIADREAAVKKREDQLLGDSPQANALAAKDKQINADAKNLKAFAEQIMKRDAELKKSESEYKERVKNFNAEAEAEMRKMVEGHDERERTLKVNEARFAKLETALAAKDADLARREEAVRKGGGYAAPAEGASKQELEAAINEKEELKKHYKAAKTQVDELDRKIVDYQRMEAAYKAQADTNAKTEEDQRTKAGKLRAVAEALAQKEAAVKANEVAVTENEAALKAREAAVTEKEASLKEREAQLSTAVPTAVPAAVPAEAPVPAALPPDIEATRKELDARKEELRLKGKELKRMKDELERRDVELKERENKLAAGGAVVTAEAAVVAAPQGAGDATLNAQAEELTQLGESLRVKGDELVKQDEVIKAREAETAKAQEALNAREQELAGKLAEVEAFKATFNEKEAGVKEREGKVQNEAESLKAFAQEMMRKAEDQKVREDNIQKMMTDVSEKEKIIKEMDEKARRLDEREEAIEKYNDELKAMEGALRRTAEEYVATGTDLKKKEDELASLKAAQDDVKQDLEKQEARTKAQLAELRSIEETLRTKATEVDRLQKGFADRENTIRNEEKRIADLTEVVKKDQSEIDALEKDLRSKEIHLVTLEDEIKDCPYCSVKEGFVATMRAIAEAKALGADVADAERLLKQARTALETENPDNAVSYNKKAIVMARDAKQKYLVYGVSYILSGAERTVRSVAQRGIDVSESERMLKSAREALEKKDYENAEGTARKAERTAILAEDKGQEVLGQLERVEKRMEEIRSFGGDVSDAEKTLQEARLLIKDKNLPDAKTRLTNAEETANGALRNFAARTRDEAQQVIAQAQREGKELSGANIFIQKAETKFNEGDYVKCIQCAREAQRLAMEAKPGTGAPSAPVSVLRTGGSQAPIVQVKRKEKPKPRVVGGPTGGAMTEQPAPQPQAPGYPPEQQDAGVYQQQQLPGYQQAYSQDTGTYPQAPASYPPQDTATYPTATTQLQPPDPTQQAASGYATYPPTMTAGPQGYECPTCHNMFSVEDPRRPVVTRCPSCGTLMKLT